MNPKQCYLGLPCADCLFKGVKIRKYIWQSIPHGKNNNLQHYEIAYRSVHVASYSYGTLKMW